MSRPSRLTPLQLTDAIARRRDGRRDITAMSGEERREAGLMDVHQAAEHEHLRALPHPRLAERVRGPVADDIWARGDERAEEEASLAVWKAWTDAGHMARGCAGWSQDFDATEVRCACGGTFAAPGTVAA